MRNVCHWETTPDLVWPLKTFTDKTVGSASFRSLLTMTAKVWTSLGIVLLVAVQHSRSQLPWFVDSFEGSACELPNGSPGTCKSKDDCRRTFNSAGQSSSGQNGQGLCGSVGPGSLVCCKKERIETTTSKTTPSTGAPPKIFTTPPTFSEHVKLRVGAKSTKYCLTHIGFNRQPWWQHSKPEKKRERRPWWEEDNNTISTTRPKPTVFTGNQGGKTYHREFPHLALLGYLAPTQVDISWNCGGTLISDRFVLTAAHCFTDSALRAPVVVRLGEHDLSVNDRTEQDYGIENTWFHPQYESRFWYHDIALVRLSTEVRFNDAIRPACLSPRPEGREREEGLVATGWGSTSIYGYSPSNVLLRGRETLNVVPRSECTKLFEFARPVMPNGVHAGMLCALDPIGDIDTCVGGAGNPLQLPTVFDVYVVTGVAVSENRFCESRTPSIFTRVSYYLEWIENIVWPNDV